MCRQCRSQRHKLLIEPVSASHCVLMVPKNMRYFSCSRFHNNSIMNLFSEKEFKYWIDYKSQKSGMTLKKLSSRYNRTHAHMNLQRLRHHAQGTHRLNRNGDSVLREGHSHKFSPLNKKFLELTLTCNGKFSFL